MEPYRGYKTTNCEFSLGTRPRFESIKIKIPKIQPIIAEKEIEEEEEEEAKSMGLEEEEEEDHEAMSVDLEGEEKKHVCCECGKEFRSGKALGGHKRIHVIETRKFSMVRRPKMVSGVVSRSEKGELEVACCVCHKKFTSMKALYGHMRFHPDRGWKGVNPPPLNPHQQLGNSSSSTLSSYDHDDDELFSSDYDHDDDHDDDDDDDELSWDHSKWEMENVLDLKDSIKGWSTKGKRGRKSVEMKIEESDPPQEEDMRNEASDLLFFAARAEATSRRKKKKKKSLSEMEKESSSTHQLDDHQIVVALGGGADQEGAGAREKHVCVTCNKSFSSYQALGGHRASHNKVKIIENHQARANVEANLLLGTEATIIGLASAQGSNSSSNNNGDHICNICYKSFPTGQALGGHKRCHWSGPISTEAPTAVPTAAPTASSSQVSETVHEVKNLKRKFLDFDLNELPPNEEEEGEERV